MYDSESSSEAGWIEWFCDLEGHEFFVAVSLSHSGACNPKPIIIATFLVFKHP